MSSRRSRERRQPEGPQVDARQQVLAEAPARDGVAPGRGWCRRSAGSRSRPPCRAPTGRKRFSSSARSSIACSSRPSSPISSRNSTPPSALRSRPGRSRGAPVKAPLHVAEQRRHRRVAAQRRAVHLDERARRPGAAPSSARRCAAPAATCRRRSARVSRIGAASARPRARSVRSSALNAALRVCDAGLQERPLVLLARARSAWRCGRSARDRGR